MILAAGTRRNAVKMRINTYCTASETGGAGFHYCNRNAGLMAGARISLATKAALQINLEWQA